MLFAKFWRGQSLLCVRIYACLCVVVCSDQATRECLSEDLCCGAEALHRRPIQALPGYRAVIGVSLATVSLYTVKCSLVPKPGESPTAGYEAKSSVEQPLRFLKITL